MLTERNVSETRSKRKRSIALVCFHYTEIDKLHIISSLDRHLNVSFCVLFVLLSVTCLTFEIVRFAYVFATIASSEYSV